MGGVLSKSTTIGQQVYGNLTVWGNNTVVTVTHVQNYYRGSKETGLEQGAPFFHSVEAPTELYQGNAEKFEQVHQLLQSHKGSPQWQKKIVAVTGIGGIGKTEFARKFAAKYYGTKEYTYIAWINAGRERDARRSFESIAKRLGVSPESDKDQVTLSELAAAVYEGLQNYAVPALASHKSSWIGRLRKRPAPAALFIFDNANQMGTLDQAQAGNDDDSTFGIRDLLPSTLQDGIDIFVLVTTQWKQWGQHISILPMDMLTEEDTLAYFKNHFKLNKEEDYTKVEPLLKNLAQLVQGYPLAITLAAANIFYVAGEDDLDSLEEELKSYVESFDESILSQGPDDFSTSKYDKTLKTVWNKSMTRLGQERNGGESAVEVLQLAAAWPEEEVEVHDLRETFTLGYPEIVFQQPVEEQVKIFQSAVRLLQRFALIKRLIADRASDEGLMIHRLVRAFVVNIRSRDDPKPLSKVLRRCLGHAYSTPFLPFSTDGFASVVKNVLGRNHSEEISLSLLLICLWKGHDAYASTKILLVKGAQFWEACRSSDTIKMVMTTWWWWSLPNQTDKWNLLRKMLVCKFFDLSQAVQIPECLENLENCPLHSWRAICFCGVSDLFDLNETAPETLLNPEIDNILSSLMTKPPNRAEYIGALPWLNLLQVVDDFKPRNVNQMCTEELLLRLLGCFIIFCRNWHWDAALPVFPFKNACAASHDLVKACHDTGTALVDTTAGDKLLMLTLDLTNVISKRAEAPDDQKPSEIRREWESWMYLAFSVIRSQGDVELCSQYLCQALPKALAAVLKYSQARHLSFSEVCPVGFYPMLSLEKEEIRDWRRYTVTMKELLKAPVSALELTNTGIESGDPTCIALFQIFIWGWFPLFKSVTCSDLTVVDVFGDLQAPVLLWDTYDKAFDVNQWDETSTNSLRWDYGKFSANREVVNEFLAATAQDSDSCEITVRARNMAKAALAFMDLLGPRKRRINTEDQTTATKNRTCNAV